MMRYKGKVLILLLMFANYACNNPEEKLLFKDKTENIQNALLEMTALVYKLPKNSFNFNTTYSFVNNGVEINNLSERSADSTQIITEQALKRLSLNDRLKFLKLAKYLNNNKISSGYIDSELNICMFLYHHSKNTSFDDVREIVVLKKTDIAVLSKSYKILDENNMIYLIAPIRPVDN